MILDLGPKRMTKVIANYFKPWIKTWNLTSCLILLVVFIKNKHLIFNSRIRWLYIHKNLNSWDALRNNQENRTTPVQRCIWLIDSWGTPTSENTIKNSSVIDRCMIFDWKQKAFVDCSNWLIIHWMPSHYYNSCSCCIPLINAGCFDLLFLFIYLSLILLQQPQTQSR